MDLKKLNLVELDVHEANTIEGGLVPLIPFCALWEPRPRRSRPHHYRSNGRGAGRSNNK